MCLIFCNFLFPFFYLLFYRSKIVTKRILYRGLDPFWQIADIYYNIFQALNQMTMLSSALITPFVSSALRL